MKKLIVLCIAIAAMLGTSNATSNLLLRSRSNDITESLRETFPEIMSAPMEQIHCAPMGGDCVTFIDGFAEFDPNCRDCQNDSNNCGQISNHCIGGATCQRGTCGNCMPGVDPGCEGPIPIQQARRKPRLR